MPDQPGYLVLSTGDIFEGKWLGSTYFSEGELVFNTAMTGYQEVMTDPSYAGQIVVMTYPLIGNYGWNVMDNESIRPSLAGLIISYPCHPPEHYQSSTTIQKMIEKYNIPCLYDVDTRAITKTIREHGEVYGKITTEKQDAPTIKRISPDIVETVSVKKITPLTGKSTATYVVIVDFGYKHSIARSLAAIGCQVTVVPFDTDLAEINKLEPDAVVLSNGPGNPQDLTHLAANIKKISESYPTFGICLGHQLLALAYGGTTKRLPYGHRGSNHPVKELATGKVMMTSQNHGYVVERNSIDPKEWDVSYVHVNDQSVQGLHHRTKPITSVQFHPEAHPGPSETISILYDFINKIPAKEVKQYAKA